MSDIKRTSLFLMANLGAEVSRIISAKKKGDDMLLQLSLKKAHDMIREIEAMDDMKSRHEEIDLLSQVIDAIVKPTPGLKVDTASIKSYFMPFALRLAATRS